MMNLASISDVVRERGTADSLLLTLRALTYATGYPSLVNGYVSSQEELLDYTTGEIQLVPDHAEMGIPLMKFPHHTWIVHSAESRYDNIPFRGNRFAFIETVATYRPGVDPDTIMGHLTGSLLLNQTEYDKLGRAVKIEEPR